MQVRVLCLGNDLIADDGLGPAVARVLRQHRLGDVEIVETPETGFYLLDHVLNCDQLIVVDTIAGGGVPPGTLREFREDDLRAPPGGSPHYIGLFETLKAGRSFGLPLPSEVTILAVEGKDLTTIGGPMSEPVRAAIPALVDRIEELACPIPAT